MQHKNEEDPGQAAEPSVEPSRTEWLASALTEGTDAAGIGVILTTSKPLQNVYASPAAGRLFHTPSSSIPKNPLDTYAREDQARLSRIASVFASQGVLPDVIEEGIPRRDGTKSFVQMGFAPTTVKEGRAAVTFLADVTPEHLALDSLRKSEARFRSVVENVPEPIFIIEGSTLAYCNSTFRALLEIGESPERPDISSFMPRAESDRLGAWIGTLVPGQTERGEYQMTAASGRALTLGLSAIAIDVDGGRSALFVGHDITESKEMEAQLLQSDRLAVLGTLAAGMSHAINNPLAYTLLNLEHVSRRLRTLNVEREYHSEARVRLAEAHDGAERVAKVVRQMRSLSRAKNSTPGPVDVRGVIDNVLAMVGNEIRYRGQLVTQCDVAPRVWAREGELEQAFLGLLLYVARSMPEQPNLERQIGVTTGADEHGNARVVVTDDGPPIPPETRARLFDPFASGETLGLGLAMCQAVLASLEGQLAVTSDPEYGTRFEVVLPGYDGAAAAESRRSLAPIPSLSLPPPQTARARVLVIDDDPGVASTLRAMLEAHHEVTSVERAREALHLLMGEQEFDVVFCDLVMPELSGMELFSALELNRPQIVDRFVFMTGGVFTPEAERFLSRVPNLRIEKPFSLTRVEQLLAYAMAPKSSSSGDAPTGT